MVSMVVLCRHQEVSQRERDKDRDREVETVAERGGKRDTEIEIVCVSLEGVYERYLYCALILNANTQRDSVTLRYFFGRTKVYYLG